METRLNRDAIQRKNCVMEQLLGGLLEYQRAWLSDRSRFKIGLWARQTGKDYTCAAEAVIDWQEVGPEPEGG